MYGEGLVRLPDHVEGLGEEREGIEVFRIRLEGDLEPSEGGEARFVGVIAEVELGSGAGVLGRWTEGQKALQDTQSVIWTLQIEQNARGGPERGDSGIDVGNATAGLGQAQMRQRVFRVQLDGLAQDLDGFAVATEGLIIRGDFVVGDERIAHEAQLGVDLGELGQDVGVLRREVGRVFLDELADLFEDGDRLQVEPLSRIVARDLVVGGDGAFVVEHARLKVTDTKEGPGVSRVVLDDLLILQDSLVVFLLVDQLGGGLEGLVSIECHDASRRHADGLPSSRLGTAPGGGQRPAAALARPGPGAHLSLMNARAEGSYRAPFAPGQPGAIDSEILRKLLEIALAQGGDYADLFFEYRASGGISFEEGITRSASRGVSMGLGVRVQKGDATGYAHVEDLSFEAMKRAAESAARIASGSPGLHVQALAPVDTASRYDLSRYTLDEPGAKKRQLLERAARAVLAYDPKLVKASASFAESVREILIATSDGRIAYDRQPMMRFGVSAVAEQNGRREAGQSGGGGRMTLAYFDGKSPEWHAERAARQALTLLDARPAPAGKLEVVLGPGDSGILLHEAVGHGLEADFNRKGTSNYTGQVGKPVASELCTVVDDPTIVQSRGAINIDDEGYEPEPHVLIENGILRGYMQDRMSARHFGVTPTGNGRREGFESAPMPRMTNTILLAGPHDPEEIVRSVKRGIYAASFGGGQVDIANGDFVFSLTESYLIEDGKITAPLKGVNLIGNGPETLRDVSMLGTDVTLSDGIWTCGKDGQSVPVGVGCPTIKIAQITVGGTELG